MLLFQTIEVEIGLNRIINLNSALDRFTFKDSADETGRES